MVGSLDDAPSGLVPDYELWTPRREDWWHALPWADQHVGDRNAEPEKPKNEAELTQRLPNYLRSNSQEGHPMNASTTIAIIAGLGFGVATGSVFGLAVIGAGVGTAASTLAAGVIDTQGDENWEL
jgi:hypothetical protein